MHKLAAAEICRYFLISIQSHTHMRIMQNIASLMLDSQKIYILVDHREREREREIIQ